MNPLSGSQFFNAIQPLLSRADYHRLRHVVLSYARAAVTRTVFSTRSNASAFDRQSRKVRVKRVKEAAEIAGGSR